MLKILWKRREIAPEEQFLLLSTIFCYLMLDFCVKTRIRFSLRDKRLFEITELQITRVDCNFFSVIYLLTRFVCVQDSLAHHIKTLQCGAQTQANVRVTTLAPRLKRQSHHGSISIYLMSSQLLCIQFCDHDIFSWF